MILSISLVTVIPALRVLFPMGKEPPVFLVKQMNIYFLMAHVNAVQRVGYLAEIVDFA